MSPPAALVQAAANFIRDAADQSLTSPDFSIATAPNPANVGVDVPIDFNAVVSTMTTSVVTAATAAATAYAHTTGGDDGGSKDQGECRLLGPFALLVQLALGGLALLSLVYKRWRERPQRPVKIWAFDASKQVFGSVLVHMANVFMSMLTSGRFNIKLDPAVVAAASKLLRRGGDDYVPNPCSFYLLNLAIDTTVGIPILIGLLRLFTILVSYTPLGKPAESIQSGNYGSPPRTWWWFKQSMIYFCGLFGMKICVLIIFLVFPWISRAGDWALGWTEGNERLQIVFVMMLFPLIMNALQYYIIDSFIKQQSPKDGSDAENIASYERISEAGSDDDARSVELGEEADAKPAPKKSKLGRPAEHEYDPTTDGDSPTAVGSSAPSRADGKVPPSLYPKE